MWGGGRRRRKRPPPDCISPSLLHNAPGTAWVRGRLCPGGLRLPAAWGGGGSRGGGGGGGQGGQPAPSLPLRPLHSRTALGVPVHVFNWLPKPLPLPQQDSGTGQGHSPASACPSEACQPQPSFEPAPHCPALCPGKSHSSCALHLVLFSVVPPQLVRTTTQALQGQPALRPCSGRLPWGSPLSCLESASLQVCLPTRTGRGWHGGPRGLYKTGRAVCPGGEATGPWPPWRGAPVPRGAQVVVQPHLSLVGGGMCGNQPLGPWASTGPSAL